MKRILFISFMYFFSISLTGQEITLVNQGTVNIQKKKIEKSLADTQNEKKMLNPKTWVEYAENLIDAELHFVQHFNVGTTKNIIELAFGKPKEMQTIEDKGKQYLLYVYPWIKIKMENDAVVDWEPLMVIEEAATEKAKKALDKAMELNTDGKSTDDIAKIFKKLKIALESNSVYAYSHEKKEDALVGFKKIVAINQMEMMKNQIDTVIIYYTGRIAAETGKNEEAIKYLEMAKVMGFKEADMYVYMKDAYLALGDTAKAVQVLMDGVKVFPKEQVVIVHLINYYLQINKHDEALEYLKVVQESDPSNVSYIFSEGVIYDQRKEYDKAEASYKRALAIKPDYFNALFNLGVMNFNKGVDVFNNAVSIKDNDRYNLEVERAQKMFHNAIPIVLQAKEVAPDLKSKLEVLETLKTLYFRVKDDENRQKVVDEITATKYLM